MFAQTHSGMSGNPKRPAGCDAADNAEGSGRLLPAATASALRSAGYVALLVLAAFVVLLSASVTWSIMGSPTSGTADLVAQGSLAVAYLSFAATVVLVATTVVSTVNGTRASRAAQDASRRAHEAFAEADRRAHVSAIAEQVAALTAAGASAVRHSTDVVPPRPFRVRPPMLHVAPRASGLMAGAVDAATLAACRLRMSGEPTVASAADEYLAVLDRYYCAAQANATADVADALRSLVDAQNCVEGAVRTLMSPVRCSDD